MISFQIDSSAMYAVILFVLILNNVIAQVVYAMIGYSTLKNYGLSKGKRWIGFFSGLIFGLVGLLICFIALKGQNEVEKKEDIKEDINDIEKKDNIG